MKIAWRFLVLAIATCGFCSCKSALLTPDLGTHETAEPVLRQQSPDRPASPNRTATTPVASPQALASPNVANDPGVAPVSYKSNLLPTQSNADPQRSVLPSPALALPQSPPALPGAHAPWQNPNEQWSPPGIAGPWPRDEYLYDGGDSNSKVLITHDWTVHGLDMEDTVAHYDTLDGQRVVEATNRVPLYAPRFSAVRKVQGLAENDSVNQLEGMRIRDGLGGLEETQLVGKALQQWQTNRQVGTKVAAGFEQRNRTGALENLQAASILRNVFEPYEDFQIIKTGVTEQNELLRLSKSVLAAKAWEHSLGVEAVADNLQVVVVRSNSKPQQTKAVEHDHGKPKLRVVKVASDQYAHPGDEIEFTLRFDNIGNRKIGNVTLIDNLTTRLEYVEGSAECNLKANFFSLPNEGDSLILRWEITDPLEPGEGGIVRFKCIVR